MYNRSGRKSAGVVEHLTCEDAGVISLIGRSRVPLGSGTHSAILPVSIK
jgi:hypothetical protein